MIWLRRYKDGRVLEIVGPFACTLDAFAYACTLRGHQMFEVTCR